MQRRVRSFFSLFLVLAMTFAFLPSISLTAAAADGVAYAVTGGNIYFDPDYGVVTGCDESVTEADIPATIDSVKVLEIGDWAFENCSALTRVSMPSELTSIGDCAFMGCSSLTSVTIPKRTNYVGGLAFVDCPSLTEILVEAGSFYFVSDNGVLLSRNKKTLYCCPEGKSGSYEAPAAVTTVLDHAFYNCKQINRLVFSNKLTTIEDAAFKGCSSLVTISLPSSLRTIGDEAFDGCSTLQRVVIPQGLTEIGRMAFSDCLSLRAISLPDTLQTIGEYTFSNCRSLSIAVLPKSLETLPNGMFLYCPSLVDVRLPEALTAIPDRTFSDCPAMRSITIPASVTSIGQNVFDRCTSLTEIKVDENNTAFVAEDGVLYTADKTKLLYCPAAREASEFVVPNTVTEIGPWAFYCYANLSRVEIPVSVTTIGTGAFEGCTVLSDVIYKGSKEQWNQISIDPEFNELLLAARYYEAYPVTGGNIYFDPEKGEVVLCTQSVTEVDIPEMINGVAVTTIGEEALCYCAYIETVKIPASVTEIKGDFCHSSSALTSIEVAAGNPNYVSVDGALFTKDKKTLIRCPAVTGEYTVPNGVTAISPLAFSHCAEIDSLVLPYSVTTVGERAFEYCYALSSVRYGGTETDRESLAIENGNKALLNAAWSYAAAFILGDVDNSGSVNVVDRVLLIRKLAKWKVEINEKAADIDGNQEVNTIDAVLLARHLAKWDISYFK